LLGQAPSRTTRRLVASNLAGARVLVLALQVMNGATASQIRARRSAFERLRLATLTILLSWAVMRVQGIELERDQV
jgi:hypothetical protein